MDTSILTSLYEAAQAGHWFVVVGLAATLLTSALKRWTPAIVERFPGSNRWIPIVIAFALSVGVAASESNGDWYRFGALAAVGGLEAAIAAIGIYHVAAPRKGGGSGPMLTGLVCLCLALPGCAALGFGTPLLDDSQAATARDVQSALSVAIDDLQAAAKCGADCGPESGPARARAHLEDARKALDLAATAITERRDPADDHRDALAAVVLALDVLEREGIDIPREVRLGLLLARFAAVTG